MDPPSRLELAKLVVAFMRSTNLDGVHRGFNASFKRTAEEIIRKPPNQDWLLALLATMNPAADIFRKDYVKPKAQRFVDADEGDDDMVENIEGYFDGLPVAGKASKKTNSVRFGDSAAAERQKLKKMQM